jgi:AcrR family transcriptional regulator
MPKIVNKEEKRKEIAFKAYEFILENGVRCFSTDALIKYMGIGKSSLYNYFKSKDEILFEVYMLGGDDYIEQLKINLQKEATLKEKLYTLFSFYLVDVIENPNLKDLYKEYTMISLEDKTEHMIEINEKFINDFQPLIKEIFMSELKKGTIKKEALDFIEYLQMSVDGIFIYSCGLKDFDLKEKIEKFINSFLKLIEV